MKRTLVSAAVAAGVAAALLLPVHLLADIASCSLLTSSYAESVINSPKGEDSDFFVNSGGIPNVMFVLDTSYSMRQLPPNGAATGWGIFEKTGNATAGAGYGCDNTWGNSLTYNSPCGTTVLDGKKYNPNYPAAAPDYFNDIKDADGLFCPRLTVGNDGKAKAATNTDPGFDPDYPSLFPGAKIFVEGNWDVDTATATSTDATTFCGNTAWSADKQSSCSTCMSKQGYWFEGTYADGSERCDTTTLCQNRGLGTCLTTSSGSGLPYASTDGTKGGYCREPKVYFTGNFLNFYPPKYVVARKVLKDVLKEVRRIRLGVTIFGGTLNTGSDGGELLADLTPTCKQAFEGTGNWDSARGSIKNAIDNKNKVTFNTWTPLAETLLQVGQYYRKTPQWFTNTYTNNSMNPTGTGSTQQISVCFSCQTSVALVITDGMASKDGAKIPGTEYAASAMTLAEAKKSTSYGGMSGFNIKGISAADCPECNGAAEAADPSIGAGECRGSQLSGGCDDSNNPTQAYLPKVAWYLNHLDLVSDTNTGADGYVMKDKQTISTYTIGLGTRGNVSQMLEDTAKAGGGLYNGGTGADITDAKTLRDAILAVLENVNTRSTSFGTASLSTLQVAAAQGVLVPRFEPSRSAHWDGHLYSFSLFSEFTSGKCVIPDTGASGPANGDLDCDKKCTSVFLQDAQGKFIQEDSTGAFKQNEFQDRAACGPGNQCTTCTGPGTTDAVPYWDAGKELQPSAPDFDAAKHAWDKRALYTVIDATSSGGKDNRIDLNDALIDLRDLSTAADYDALVPYLNIRGSTFCSKLATRLTSVGNPAGATIVGQLATSGGAVYSACAKAIMDFVRGADIFNDRAASPFPSSYQTRAYQLGDVFHSSPVEVVSPLASDGFLCIRGLHNQCLPSLFSASIPNPSVGGNANAYDDYAKSTRYKHRNKFTLVGANDGMLHAIQTGTWHPAGAGCVDPTETPANECAAPYEGYYDAGTGEEIWGFIPPDLLPKLKLLLESAHQYYVDGTPMVRDVWVDGGWANATGGSVNADGTRAKGEFHTVAVVGERRGGTHYFALDVTDAGDDLLGKPKFLWIYPQPNDPEQLSFGETYVEFLPKAPPMGPVRIDAGPPPCTGGAKEYAASTGTRCFKEDWVVFLSGGFDPQYTRGRGVHMVEIGTGNELFDFSRPAVAASACGATSDPRCHLNYPVVATVGMMMWGKQANYLTAAASDGYFDTATFGDTGGQMWVLRFNDPGIIDATTGKVKNWHGARVFQNGLTSSTPPSGVDLWNGQPFFYITSNLPLAANGLLRTLNGTGDRFNLLDQQGGTCGPDNIRACLQKGCSVTLQDAAGTGPGAAFGVEPLLGKETYGMSLPSSMGSFVASSFTQGGPSPGATSCTTLTTKIDGLKITCPSTTTCSGAEEIETKRTSIKCSAGDSCDPASTNDHGMTVANKGDPTTKNWFFSLQVFANSGSRQIFTDLDGAKLYDAARLTESDLTDINAADAATSNPVFADPAGKGWKYYFDHGSPNTVDTVTLDEGVHKIWRADERTASVSAVESGCTFWNTMQSAVPSAAFDTSLPVGCQHVGTPCKAGRAQVSYLYGASPSTGAKCLLVDGTSKRSNMSVSLVPPNIGKLVAYVSSGQVAFGLTSVRIPQGGANVSLGEAQDLSAQMGWLPVTRDEHMCRHAPKATPPDPKLCK